MRIVSARFKENLKMAIGTLRANKLRSFLTIFGVVIGVITVMLIAAIISGIQLAVEEQVKSFGTRSILASALAAPPSKNVNGRILPSTMFTHFVNFLRSRRRFPS
jgi:ABC-type antimicrobial peptide transport system permease subunit